MSNCHPKEMNLAYHVFEPTLRLHASIRESRIPHLLHPHFSLLSLYTVCSHTVSPTLPPSHTVFPHSVFPYLLPTPFTPSSLMPSPLTLPSPPQPSPTHCIPISAGLLFSGCLFCVDLLGILRAFMG